MSEAPEEPPRFRQGYIVQTPEQRQAAEAYDAAQKRRQAELEPILNPARRREDQAERERLAEEERLRQHPNPRAERAHAYLEMRAALAEVERLRAHLATAKEVLACAVRIEAEARERDERTMGAASQALRKAIEDGADITLLPDPELPGRMGVEDAAAGRQIAERAVAELEEDHAAALRLLAGRKAAVDAAELALTIALAVDKAAELRRMQAEMQPLVDWIDRAAGLRVHGPGGILGPIPLPPAVRQAITPVDPVLNGALRGAAPFRDLADAIEAAGD